MWFTIDRQSKVPMFRQVFEACRGAILSGALAAGCKLPSTRELSAELHVSRNVILEAYELLMAEGYIEGRSGAGTYVAEGTRLPGYKTPPQSGPPVESPVMLRAERAGAISFRTGAPALDQLPLKAWASALQSVCLEAAPAELGYGDPAGSPELRSVLAEHLWKSRGVLCHPDHIVITNGALQALQIVVKVLVAGGDEVFVESPSNEDLKLVLTSTGAELREIPVDDAGLLTDHLPAGGSPKLVYVTPSHQFPLGGILPIQRRIALMEYARRCGGYLVEDDYDSEFRYDGPPLQSLQSLCPERVIYVGTFSKTLFPALRVGYMVLPGPLVEPCRKLKRLADYQTPIIEQLALVRFMSEGHLTAHVHRMKKLYRQRRDALLEALARHMGRGYRICGRPAGMHLVVEFAAPLPEDWERRLTGAQVQAAALPGRRLLLGYGHLSGEEIEEGIRRIGRALG
ncbi:MocR-like pyridoxine biosynthesis transcription factor PdxR [Paenibacillus caseinilyticus]|uniref:MocR-like pyridoxine biosynthesis transcription factor PdxR n=1 Tax=Paenibacillus caseinilyticus TaxID=3098138 RepID=UPI0022B912C7|nr:PLP-dependent aminotransferase family protein [Paenibacillus caseinilyticus]MCZ8520341.1 PLP-dependent aminotransferase family protein [Paenibacillus caseinilyticus]